MTRTFELLAGWTLITVTSIAYIYYTVWVIVLPFVDKDQIFHQVFPDHKYALGIPLLMGVTGLAVIGLFVLLTCRGQRVKSN
ncbi:uncharacterized protein [Mytilus edulis]|uniref:uncharacterized protein n=1 Tax=Mytilus edulis TaxID=6550 RepID=UPI0039EF9747